MQLSIGEVSRRTGVSVTALRYYESEGLLPAPERVGGQRRYRLRALRQVVLVRMARRAGLSVSDARALLDALPEGSSPARRWQAVGRKQLAHIDERISELSALRSAVAHCLDCGCMDAEVCTLLDPA